ncbi:MAG TPA: DUF1707 domain-containing protein [Streptosporangiaceae bacterium]
MTTGPHNQRAADAAGRGPFRASDADREQVADALKTAYAQGRLTMDELVMRAGLAFASRTYAELTAITADLPTGRFSPPLPPVPAPAPALPGPVPEQTPARKKVSRKLVLLGACALISPGLGVAFLTFYGGFIILFVLAFVGLTLSETAR